MGILELLWLLVIVAVLQPVLRRRMLESARRRLRVTLEQRRGSRVILLVHRLETMSVFGIPLMRYIDIQDAEEVIRAIHDTAPDVPIDIVLHTPGGLALPSLQIARALARHPATVTAFVPHYAMSGGTLIALAADRIVMSEDAVLGPIDPQVGEYPAVSILRAVARKEIKDVEDQTLILADQAEMAIRQLRHSVVEILGERMKPELAEYIAGELAEGRSTHDHPITAQEARRMGLEVDTDLPREIVDMMRLYPQPVRQSRSVEYGSRRREAPDEPGGEAGPATRPRDQGGG